MRSSSFIVCLFVFRFFFLRVLFFFFFFFFLPRRYCYRFLLHSHSNLVGLNTPKHTKLLEHCHEVLLASMDESNCLALLSHAVENSNLRAKSGTLKQHLLAYIVTHYEALATVGESSQGAASRPEADAGTSGLRLQQLPTHLFQEVQVAFNVHLLRLTLASLAAKKS
jgi:hypothetical protein